MVQCLHEPSPCVSPVFICSSGDLVVHLLQGGEVGSLDLKSSCAPFSICPLELVPY